MNEAIRKSIESCRNPQLLFNPQRSHIQIELERNGCVFMGQELLSNHEIDLGKECYCGRPNK